MSNELNKPAISELVDALRSGRYPQDYGRLVSTNEQGNLFYCCLGVACAMAKSYLPSLHMVAELRPNPTKPPDYAFRDTTDSSNPCANPCTLPQIVAEFYGFFDSHGRPMTNPKIKVELNGKIVEMTATEANDIYKLSLDAIADGFERTYLQDESE